GRVMPVACGALHHRAVEILRQVERGAGEEIVAGEIERRVRSEAPRESAVHLRTDVARITLHEASVTHRNPEEATQGALTRVQGRATRVAVHLLRRPRRRDDAV